MERESFVFYRSFYEAVQDLPKDIRLEVLTAIIEYALFGRHPEDLKPFARAMFTLVKPNIDNSTTRYINGSKGGRKSKKKSATSESPYTLSYDQEADAMRADQDWIQSVCSDFDISPDQLESRLSRFLKQCHDDAKKKGKSGHESEEDARSHFRYWMLKAFPDAPQSQSPSLWSERSEDSPSSPPDYSYRGGFGSIDS